MPEKPIAPPWLATLRQHVESKPCVLLRLDESDSGTGGVLGVRSAGCFYQDTQVRRRARITFLRS